MSSLRNPASSSSLSSCSTTSTTTWHKTPENLGTQKGLLEIRPGGLPDCVINLIDQEVQTDQSLAGGQQQRRQVSNDSVESYEPNKNHSLNPFASREMEPQIRTIRYLQWSTQQLTSQVLLQQSRRRPPRAPHRELTVQRLCGKKQSES